MIAVLRGLHPSVRVRLLTTFLNKVFGTAVLPFLGLLFAQRAGVVVAGVLLVAHYLTQFGVGLYGGVLSDTLGRKRLMVWGEGVKVLAFALMLFAALGGQSVWPIFLGTLVLAVGNGLSCPAGEALLIDASTPTDRPVMYALSNWGHNIGYLVGAPLGALLFTDHLADLLALLTGMAMLVWWVSLRFIQDVYLPVCRAERPSFGLKALVGSYRQVASDRAFVWFTLSGVLILSTEFARTTFLAVRLGQGPGGQHLTLPVLGTFTFDGAHALALLSAENTLLIVLGTGLVARFLSGRAPRHWMLLGSVLFGGGYCAVMLVGTPVALLLAGLVFSVGELLYTPTRQAVVAELIDTQRRGAYMAVNTMIFQFAKILASCGLIFWPLLGQGGLVALMVGFTLAGSVVAWLSSTRHRAVSTLLTEGVPGD